MHRDLARASALTLFLLAPPALAQTLNGGQQSLAWPAGCATDVTFTNATLLPLAGLWIAVDAVGVNSPPEIREITVHDAMGMKTWDVDDDEDLDNDDAGENDVIDASPLGPPTSNGWHRVQARSNADVLAAGASFTLRLCDSAGNSVAGRTVFLIPIAQKAGQAGGDLGARVALPMAVSRIASSGFATIVATGAPPNSTDFSAALVNADASLSYRKVIVSPPTGIAIVNASASSGGAFEGAQRAIVWPAPIPPGCVEQMNVTLDALNVSTSVAFTCVLKVAEK